MNRLNNHCNCLMKILRNLPKIQDNLTETWDHEQQHQETQCACLTDTAFFSRSHSWQRRRQKQAQPIYLSMNLSVRDFLWRGPMAPLLSDHLPQAHVHNTLIAMHPYSMYLSCWWNRFFIPLSLLSLSLNHTRPLLLTPYLHII